MLDVIERWIQYYWPLMDRGADFIPQIRGGREAFRPLLQKLIDQYQGRGGLDRFAVDYRDGRLATDTAATLDELRRVLKNTIQDGPIKHAGGALATGRLFSYDRGTRRIILTGEIWCELCLAGHWIRDALILRWAEESEKISRGEVKASQVIDRLLIAPTEERDILAARQIYQRIPDKECVWTGRSLGRSFEVDHVLPFALWRNNQLWNLLPASAQANHLKRDNLPSVALLKRRREAVLHYWEIMSREIPTRFEMEANRLAGCPKLDFPRTFTALLEAVEVTALQRGCRQWEP